MSPTIQPERATQNRIAALFRDRLGYRHLGDRSDRTDNSNIDEPVLTAWLTVRGIQSGAIAIALHKLKTEADNANRGLYANNEAVYSLLRYGVPVKEEAGKVTETVHLIDWKHPDRRLRHRRGGDAQGRQRAPPGHCALHQRHCYRRHRAEEQPHDHRRRHPAIALQPAA